MKDELPDLFVGVVITVILFLLIIILFETPEKKYVSSDLSENWDSLIYVTKHYDTIHFKWLKPEDCNMTFYINNVKQEP